VSDFDTEMAFVRALSVGGTKLSGDMSAEDKRERIRVAILTQKRSDKNFGIGPAHTMETYAQAFERCYHRSVEMRRGQRDFDGKPILVDATSPPEADEDEDDED
jgi:hypothetical protein